MTKPVKRSYNSTGRRAQAQQTQRAILRAAHDLFVGQGYGRTTIAQVAERAGVSPETIYATFRNKATLLHRTWDVTIGGDDEEVVFHERPEVMAIRAEPDLARRLELHARLSTATARRMTPFVRSVQGAAASEPSAAKMATEMERQRLAGLSVMAREAAETGQLRVSEEECRDIMWATTDGHLWHQLVVERGWSDEKYAEWLARTWIAHLVL
ncbi:TetR/AcrR family transcriptional regulator [Aeromicrobium panaciterrae]|uniref:TetR/AcrR family transcriptional regulator n=1 Tax=Aeromicrobium panaciterrae TaxID=363861 RepID=UPI0031DD2E69